MRGGVSWRKTVIRLLHRYSDGRLQGVGRWRWWIVAVLGMKMGLSDTDIDIELRGLSVRMVVKV